MFATVSDVLGWLGSATVWAVITIVVGCIALAVAVGTTIGFLVAPVKWRLAVAVTGIAVVAAWVAVWFLIVEDVIARTTPLTALAAGTIVWLFGLTAVARTDRWATPAALLPSDPVFVTDADKAVFELRQEIGLLRADVRAAIDGIDASGPRLAALPPVEISTAPTAAVAEAPVEVAQEPAEPEPFNLNDVEDGPGEIVVEFEVGGEPAEIVYDEDDAPKEHQPKKPRRLRKVGR